MLRNMTFRSKILSVLLLTTALLSSFSFVFIQSMNEMNQVSDDLTNRNIPEFVWLSHWEETLHVKEHMVETALISEFCCDFIDRYEVYQRDADEELIEEYGQVPRALEHLKREMDLLDFLIINEVSGLISFGSEDAAASVIQEQYLTQMSELHQDVHAEKDAVLTSLKGHSDRFSYIIEDSLWLLLLLTSLAIILSILAAYIISKDLTRPVEKIERKLGKIAKGQYGLTLEEANQVELKSLTKSINAMSVRLKESFETIMDDKVYREQILNSLPIGIVTSDEKTGDLVLNDAAKQLLGSQPEHIWSLVGRKNYPINKDFWLAFSSKEIFQNVKLSYQSSEGQRFLLVSQSQLVNRNREIIGKVFYYIDITETEELEKKMQQNEKLAYVGELSAGAAHEIRNPLAVIDGFLSLMNQSLSSGEREQYRVPLLLKELERINSIIEEMLMLTKPSAPNMKKVYLEDILQDILPLIKQSAGNEEIQFHIQLQPSPLYIDPAQMKQVLHNLVRNSVEAMDGSGEISITSEILDNKYQIFLQDTGPGIPENIKREIFDPFLTSKDSGTGLGLTIAQRILNNHEGKLELLSSSESGTCFLLELPFSEGQ
ncbi:two-component sensor histidine kinase [Salipaludibacillus keqinensis]|uniref:histidine kinase n=2 Tax=Salipaludibacillus keqinensis TaxID=2045207 RepID=A0A323TCY2_9BACI|nr:two-component sensor histidine kinase [Salipaludibacillus keqinensis]